MVHITIDGIDLNVAEGRNILDAALESGIYIPHLCHHPDLIPMEGCRLCIVEAEGIDGVVPSCSLMVKDGLNIKTTGDEIKRLRLLALELLLAGHPEDCTTCAKYGNCELQTVIQYIGPHTGRLKMRVKGFKQDERNPLFSHEMNRCVLCGRCVRACNELRGVGALQYLKKETETYVGTLHNRLLADSDCRFCGACAEVCPTGAIQDKISLTANGIRREDGAVPCKHACPVHTDIPRYIRYINQGKYNEAMGVIREKLPFPKILGMVCNHVCEKECRRKEVSDPMSIRNIKRYGAENDSVSFWKGKGKHLSETGKHICVVGGGPAGLTAAYYLRKQGHTVTIKEALPAVGGMLSFGIPSYRLPRTVIAGEVSIVEDSGVIIQTNTRVEKLSDVQGKFDTVLFTIGGHAGVRLPMEGNNLKGVILNTDFLRSVSLDKETGMGGRVVVLGGGNVAFDCARTAKRLGAQEVHVACLETRENMLADEEEIQQALEEGIAIHPGRTFERIRGTANVTGVDFMKVESFSFDENRRAIIKKKEGSNETIEADTVIFAVGQRPDISESFGLELGRGNCIQVKDKSTATAIPGVFAAGDAIYGTKSVIMAIASGRDAAGEIDRYLGGDGDISEILVPFEQSENRIGVIPGFSAMKRAGVHITQAVERTKNFDLVDLGIPQESICGESSRCLQCDIRLRIKRPRLWADYSSSVEPKNQKEL
jgi:NADPH-dependent glutamate synthase beta subunit-like oxidoreductase/ferredoxin/Pyruvate/2-oxoacid:ferredoxin oxidoreductase delta subunit